MTERVSCLYLDLDGTLLSPTASLLHDGDGSICIDGVRAIQACLRAGVEVVLMSGRRQVQVAEDARLLGQRSYIFECGGCVVFEGEEHWLTGEMQPGARTVADQIEATGAPAMLLERYQGRLEYHEPWHVQREVSHLFRGLVDAAEVDRLLADNGWQALRLVDNGVVTRRSEALSGLSHVRGYHLLPAGVSKATAVALHRRMRGYEPEQTFAIGDSREDLVCAREVGEFWLVANALTNDPSLGEAVVGSPDWIREPRSGNPDSTRGAVAGNPNLRLAHNGYGRGVYEAVVSKLMTR